jgi:hypothetical protein
MGHWDKQNGAENPTLLASGFTPWDPNTGPRKILVYMWPIQVQTELTSSNLLDPAPEIVVVTGPDGEGKPITTTKENLNVPMTYHPDTGVFELWAADWEMKWTLTTAGGIDPLAPLIAAQEIFAAEKKGEIVPNTAPDGGIWDADYSSTTHSLAVKNAVIKTTGERYPEAVDEQKFPWADTPDLPRTNDGGVNKVITGDISGYTRGPANQLNKGSVNFNLGYVPFNLTDPEEWREWNGDSEFILDGGGLPVWIIRNGINDAAQDGATDFDRPPGAGANGNGAAAFEVKHRYWAAKVNVLEFSWIEVVDVLEDEKKVKKEVKVEYVKYAGPVGLGEGPSWGMTGSPFQYGGQTTDGILVSVSVWDDYNQRLLTGEESSGVVEFELDWDRITSVEGYPGNYKELLQPVPEDHKEGLRFRLDDNNRQQRLVRVIDHGHTWGVYVKGTLRKGIKDTTFEDWTGTSSFTLMW